MRAFTLSRHHASYGNKRINIMHPLLQWSIGIGALWPLFWLYGAAWSEGFKFWTIPMMIASTIMYLYLIIIVMTL